MTGEAVEQDVNQGFTVISDHDAAGHLHQLVDLPSRGLLVSNNGRRSTVSPRENDLYALQKRGLVEYLPRHLRQIKWTGSIVMRDAGARKLQPITHIDCT